MRREDLSTELGKKVYDYSPIRKNDIPREVLADITNSYFKRNEIVKHVSWILNDDIVVFFADAEGTLQLFSDWRQSFTVFGYQPPILEFTS